MCICWITAKPTRKRNAFIHIFGETFFFSYSGKFKRAAREAVWRQKRCILRTRTLPSDWTNKTTFFCVSCRSSAVNTGWLMGDQYNSWDSCKKALRGRQRPEAAQDHRILYGLRGSNRPTAHFTNALSRGGPAVLTALLRLICADRRPREMHHDWQHWAPLRTCIRQIKMRWLTCVSKGGEPA